MGNETGTVRQEFGAQSIQKTGDTAVSAVAARAKAQIETRAIMAMQRPRNWDVVRTKLLDECKRPGFAAAARYRKPIGQGVEGPSIRFAEAAIRHMTNLAVETTVTYDDEEKLILRVSVSDLESNVPFEQDVVINKTVERKKLKPNQRPLGSRVNSYGDTVFLVPATDDDILNKQNALVSKALRTQALRLLPGDILDECMAKCIEIVRTADAKDPLEARKKIVDGFHALGVNADELVKYLDHPLDACTPAELQELRAVFAALKEGETTWKAIMLSRQESTSGEEEDSKVTAAKEKTRAILDKRKRDIANKNGGKKSEPAAAKEDPVETTGEPAPEYDRGDDPDNY